MSIEASGVAAPPGPAGPWVDVAPVSVDWAPPTGSGPPPAAPGRRVPAGVIYGVIGLSLVLLVAAIWGLGGLKQRMDLFHEVPVGSMISTGPYELSFTEVTAQRKVDYTDKPYWEVVALGSGRTTGVSTIAPDWDGRNGMFVAKDAESAEVEDPSGARFGGPDASLDRDAFAPGLGPIPYAVTFKFNESYRPGTSLRVVVYDLNFYDNSLLRDGEEAWHNSSHGSRLVLPVRVLPGEK